MCCIAGSQNQEEVKAMLALQRHRAPDEEGVYKGDYSVGMGRLAIQDIHSDGLSPLVEDNYVLAFNGEIYNFWELREELERLGYKFRTNSDTEVLMKCYREWGLKMFDKLNGMFAFAIYDGHDILLARDIAGEKPLYYTENPFRFASEAKALNFDCKELPKAHYALWTRGKLILRKYWEPKRVKILEPEHDLEKLLDDSIKLRMRADVPYGLYLSGGVDSSLINTFSHFEHTFTYEDNGNKEEFLADIDKIIYHLDYPVRSPSPFGLWQLAKEASKNVKVVLSGEGADELFGGYVRFVKPEFEYQAVKRFPSYRAMFPNAKSVADSCREEFDGNMQELLRMGDRMAGAWGIENRCPFLDKRIIEFAFSLPSELRISGLDTKVILNRVLKKRNPHYKPIEKEGLYCSLVEWLWGEKIPRDQWHLYKDRWFRYQFENRNPKRRRASSGEFYRVDEKVPSQEAIFRPIRRS